MAPALIREIRAIPGNGVSRPLDPISESFDAIRHGSLSSQNTIKKN